MTTYATVAELASVALARWDDLAELSSRDSAVTGELLEQFATDGSIDEPADVVAANAEALTMLEAALDDVSRYTDSYLVGLHRDSLPLSASVLAQTGLPNAVATIALGRLHGAGQTDELARLVKQAEQYLRDLSRGVAALPSDAPSTPDLPGKMHIKSRPSAFNWGNY